MIVKSVTQTRLGFETKKWWRVGFTSNDIMKSHRTIIQALATDSESVIPILRSLERENGYSVAPLTGKVCEIIKTMSN